MAASGAFYGVVTDATEGVYRSWSDVSSIVNGVSKAQFKKFSSQSEAEAFVSSNSRRAPPRPPGILDDCPPGLSPPEVRRPAKSEVEEAKAHVSRTAAASLFCDGSSIGNPGPGGAGVLILDADGKELGRESVFLGANVTNNVAEYSAVIAGLGRAAQLGLKDVVVHADSQLVIRQMTGQYRVKDATLQFLKAKADALLPFFSSVSFVHIPREQNTVADALAFQASSGGK